MPTNLTGTRISDTYQQVLHVSEGVTTEEKPVVSGTGVASTIRLGTESMSARQLSLDVPLAITSGGTDANNPPDARYNLGCGDVATTWYPDPPDGTVFLAGDATWKPAGGGSELYRGHLRFEYESGVKSALEDDTYAPFVAQDGSGASYVGLYAEYPDPGVALEYTALSGPVLTSSRAGVVLIVIKVFFDNSDSATHYVTLSADGSRDIRQKYAIPPGGSGVEYTTLTYMHPDLWRGPGGSWIDYYDPAYDLAEAYDENTPELNAQVIGLCWMTDSAASVTYTTGSVEVVYMYDQKPWEPA